MRGIEELTGPRLAYAAVAATCALLVGCSTGPGPEESPSPDAPASDTDPVDEEPTTAGEPTGESPEGDVPHPAEGAVLSVVGVPADDVLNVREEPDPAAAVVIELPPVADESMTASGENVRLDDGQVWARITVEGEGHEGWVNAAYVSHRGVTSDVTDEVDPSLTAESLVALAELVGAHRVSDAPDPAITVVAESDDGSDSVYVDVLGYADDSVQGERLRVVGIADHDEWQVGVVEATTWCARGVADGGLCL